MTKLLFSVLFVFAISAQAAVPSLIASTPFAASTDGGSENVITTSTLDCTGANSYMIVAAYFKNTDAEISDSQTGFYSVIPNDVWLHNENYQFKVFWSSGRPSYSSISFTAKGNLVSISGACFANAGAEHLHMTTAGCGTCQGSGMTTTVDNTLEISAITFDGSVALSSGQEYGYTVIRSTTSTGGQHAGLAWAMRTQATAGFVAPSWDVSGGDGALLNVSLTYDTTGGGGGGGGAPAPVRRRVIL